MEAEFELIGPEARQVAAVFVTPPVSGEGLLTLDGLAEALGRLVAAGAPGSAKIEVIDCQRFHSVRASWPL